MADIKFLSGTVSNISIISSTSGSSYKGTGSTNTYQIFTFRVNNKPVTFSGVLNLSEGDEVKVAGYYKSGELEAVVVNNITLGVGYLVNLGAKSLYWFIIFLMVGLCILPLFGPGGINALPFIIPIALLFMSPATPFPLKE